MSTLRFNPSRLDVAALAKACQEIAGNETPARFPRLLDVVLVPAADAPRTTWAARGEERPVRGGAPQIWLHLKVRAEVSLECQRCLQPMALPLGIERSFLFARDEAQAEQLDEALEDDVIALTRSLDLLELVEDELLLALPLVPRHERCPQPLTQTSASHAGDAPIDPSDHAAQSVDESVDESAPGGDQPATAAEHPFAGLAQLKGRLRRAD